MQIGGIYGKVDTKILISKCIQKDPLGWSEFIARFSPIVYRAIRKRLENHTFRYTEEDVKDLRQSFFIKLIQEKSLNDVKGFSNINYWVCMVAANFATDFYRRSQKDILNNSVSIFEDVVINNETVALKEFIASNELSPRKKIEKRQLMQNLENAISELPREEKIVFKLSVIHNKKLREIAKVRGISLNTAASAIRRAKQKILKYFEQK